MLLSLAVVGCTVQPGSNSNQSDVQATDTKWCIEPKGEEEICIEVNESVGKSAEEGLKLADSKSDQVEVEIQTSDSGSFVVSVNGFEPNVSAEFWEFNVNGEQATVGISSYIVSAGDKLELRLAQIEAGN